MTDSDATDEPTLIARRFWQLIEPLHAITYFAPESADAMVRLGLKGFWMGYFAGRAAPMGAVGAGMVEATFANFAPVLVRRAIPESWARTTPEVVLVARRDAAATVLRRVIPNVETEAGRVVPLLSSVVRSARADGRPLFAANRDVPLSDDPVEALWQCCTTLREHRGDGHVAAQVAHDVSGLDAHLLLGMPTEMLGPVRGWTPDECSAAIDGLHQRGLLELDGSRTDAGRELRRVIESETDVAAAHAWNDGLTEAGIDLLPGLLRPLASAISSAGILPFPNPIGLPDAT